MDERAQRALRGVEHEEHETGFLANEVSSAGVNKKCSSMPYEHRPDVCH